MTIFDLEQEIMKCWNITDDLDVVTQHFVDSPDWKDIAAKVCDALMNKYSGIKELYDVRFQRLWDTFEKVCKEYHEYRNYCEHGIELPFPDDALDLMNYADGAVDDFTITLTPEIEEMIVGNTDVAEEKE